MVERPVDDETRTRCITHLLDWLGSAFAAASTVEGQILLQYAAACPSGRVTFLGGGSSDAATAAFVNGGLGIVLEFDDVHRGSRLHPGPVVMATALAGAEMWGSTPQQFLDAIARGYEAMIRVGESLGADHSHYWHNTSTCGPFGSTVAAASLLALDGDQLGHALGNAGTQSAGLWQCRPERTMSKSLHVGRAAQAGLLAAQLAKLGFTGPKQILEGEFGLFAATSPGAEPEIALLPAPSWKIFETSLKPWPGCRHVHPSIDAGLGVREGMPKDVHVERVEIETYQAALDFADCFSPRNSQEALFSLQHAVAWTLLYGAPGLEAFTQKALNDPDVSALRRKVIVTSSPRFAHAYPSHWGARVRVFTGKGTFESERIDTRGDPEFPLSVPEVLRKTRSLLAHGRADPDAAEELLAEVLSLSKARDLSSFFSALRRLGNGTRLT